MFKPSKMFFFFLVVLVLGAGTGCSTVKNLQKNQQQKRDDAELKKTRYIALKRDLSSRGLRNGTIAEDIKIKYGPPDDVFYSSSSISSSLIPT